MIRFACGKCDEEMEISDRMAGRKIECVSCGARVRVPELNEQDYEEEKPPRGRREADDAARPPKRRSEIAEGEPPPRRRREIEEEDAPPRKKKRRGGLRRSVLRQVAIYQKAIMLCILAYILLGLINGICWSAGVSPLARIPIGLLALAAIITGAVFVFMMALELYSVAAGVILGLFALIPLIGLIVLLVINGKATAALRDGGFEVGFLGVPLWQFDE